MFFTETRYRSINTGSINSNTTNIIRLRICSKCEKRCLTQKFATRWGVTSVQSLSSPSHIYILISVPKGIRNLLTIRNSRLLLSLRPFLLLFALLAGSVFRSDPVTRIKRNLAFTCLNTQKTLQYKHHKRATNSIVTIVFDINVCKNKISNHHRLEVWIKSRLGRLFLLILYFFYCFWFFRLFLYVFGF